MVHYLLPYFCFFLFGLLESCTKGGIMINDNKWRNCVGAKTPRITIEKFENTPFEQSHRVFSVNNTLPNMTLATLEVSYCSLEDHPDACDQEFFKKFILPCSKVIDKHEPWSNFIESLEPKLECPFKSGLYTSDAPAIDLWKIHEQDLGEIKPGSYQVYFNLSSQRGTILCFDIEYEVKFV